MLQKAGLSNKNGRRIALKSVHIEGQVDGLLASMTLTQHYSNDTGKKLEIVYTFPLAWGAVLLGMDVTIGGRRLQTVVLGKAEAWEMYEGAIDWGNTPILVERAGLDLYTINLGNIERGEEVTVKLRYAQCLSTQDGRPSLRIPCTIAPRYGDPHKDGDLAPHETTAADMLAQYPLSIKVTLLDQMAKAEVMSLSHQCDISKTENATVITLNSGAMLDRDFIFSLHGLSGHSLALLAPDDNKHMMLASFSSKLPHTREPLRLKILVDCSEGMLGDGILTARRILFCLLGILEPDDYISFSRFGNTVQHETTQMWECSQDMPKRLASLIESIQADMGGAQMKEALLSTFNDIVMPEGDNFSPCVLLITTGAVWNAEQIVDAVNCSGHRIFALGVSHAPVERLLYRLTEKTGGAGMFVSPAETTLSIKHMLKKMCGAQATQLNVDWGSEPEWQSSLPSSAYEGDTVHVFASFAEAPTHLPVLRWNINGSEQQTRVETISRTDNKAITRMGWAQRIAETDTQEESLTLALKYQVVGKGCSMFLEHIREQEKNGEPPVLQQIPQMIAAGYKGLGSARFPLEEVGLYCLRETLLKSKPASWQLLDDGMEAGPAKNAKTDDTSTWRTNRASYSSDDFLTHLAAAKTAKTTAEASEFEAIDTPVHLKRTKPCEASSTESGHTAENKKFQFILYTFEKIASCTTDGDQAMQQLADALDYPALKNVLAQIARKESLTTGQVWALLLFWLFHGHFRVPSIPSHNALHLLRKALNTKEVKNRYAVKEAEEQIYAAIAGQQRRW